MFTELNSTLTRRKVLNSSNQCSGQKLRALVTAADIRALYIPESRGWRILRGTFNSWQYYKVILTNHSKSYYANFLSFILNRSLELNLTYTVTSTPLSLNRMVHHAGRDTVSGFSWGVQFVFFWSINVHLLAFTMWYNRGKSNQYTLVWCRISSLSPFLSFVSFFIPFLFYLKNKHYLQVRRPGLAFGRKTNNIRYRGGSRIFFRRGCTPLLLHFNTNKPNSFFFFCKIPVVVR